MPELYRDVFSFQVWISSRSENLFQTHILACWRIAPLAPSRCARSEKGTSSLGN